MYAVVKTGGKQYRVSKDDIITVEKLIADSGTSVEFDRILVVGSEDKVEIGTPYVEGARVTAEVIDQTRGRKVLVYRKLRRKDFQRLKGHRQKITVLKITGILLEGAIGAPKSKGSTAREARTEESTVKKTTAKKTVAKKTTAKKTAAKKTASKKAPPK